MSLLRDSDFVAGGEEFDLNHIHDFINTYNGVANGTSPSAGGLLSSPRPIPSPARPLEDFLGQPVGRLSPSAAGPVDLDATDFDILPAAAHRVPSLSPTELADTRITIEVPIPAPKLSGGNQPSSSSSSSARKHKSTAKVTKPKTTPKMTRDQRTKSSSPSTPPQRRSIDELLTTNFSSLNAQEKTRVLLPLLRKLNPRELESSLAELPCVKAKGFGHEAHVVNAIHSSPPTVDADDVLATRLTFGTISSPTLAASSVTTSSPLPQPQASPSRRKVTHIEVGDELGGM